ncbi:MAG: hypothetical protein KatS3mg009_3127 [Acidimicrobiia bacterium]|nr:MAG: hypothetical protein KatS3mg009_3127 [Acidimicrobiia bacterium]
MAWDDFVARGTRVTDRSSTRAPALIGPDDPSDVVFTSGTTGSPKGVVMTHGQTLRAYLDWCDWADLRPGDRYLIVNPFFHIFGYKAGCLACLMRGATIHPLAVFDAASALEIVERERITVLPGPPTLYHSLLDHPDRARRDVSSLRVGVTGAADIPVELVRRVREELPFERLLTGYGLTEAGTVTGSRPDDDFEHVATTVGVPWPGFEVRVVTDAGRGCADRRAGRGARARRDRDARLPRRPGGDAAAIDADGWLHTGDVGTVDADGHLRIVGRIKDMFIVGGFNAYPAEIENLMLRHPRIAQVAVIGVPDERLGEVAKAFVVLHPGPPIEEWEIVEWARGEMANYKAPRSVEFLDALPVNATGKVVKDELRARGGAVVTAARGEGGRAARSEPLMARVPVAEGIFTWPSDEPRLIGSRCRACAHRDVPRAAVVPAMRVDRHGRAAAVAARASVGLDHAALPAARAALRGADRRRLRAVRRRVRGARRRGAASRHAPHDHGSRGARAGDGDGAGASCRSGPTIRRRTRS